MHRKSVGFFLLGVIVGGVVMVFFAPTNVTQFTCRVFRDEPVDEPVMCPVYPECEPQPQIEHFAHQLRVKRDDAIQQDTVDTLQQDALNKSPLVTDLTTESTVGSTTEFTGDSMQEDVQTNPQPRKILLDCGANVASTVELFRNTYPGGRNFTIHSFEIDEALAPYFSPYEDHVMHCPEGVSGKDGTMTAYTESVWSPTRGKNNGKDMQWGGGSLFAFADEKKDSKTGGKRKLSRRPTIPVVDLSRWIQENTRIEDYVIFKLDVEGAEYDILKKMLKEGTFKWIDKYYGEFHKWQPVTGWTSRAKADMQSKFKTSRASGLQMVGWGAETRGYKDFDKLHPIKVPRTTSGIAGTTYSTCGSQKLALTVAVGMNLKRALKIVSILTAYPTRIPITLFVYGEFAEQYPAEVKSWATRFDIGVREDGLYPPGHFELMRTPWIREALVSTEMRLQEIDIQPAFYFPVNINKNVIAEAQARGFRLIKPTIKFPPDEGTLLKYDNYYQYSDTDRVTAAIQFLSNRLQETKGGILSLDTDLPDTRMNLVVLLEYLVTASGFDLVSVDNCVDSAKLDVMTSPE